MTRPITLVAAALCAAFLTPVIAGDPVPHLADPAPSPATPMAVVPGAAGMVFTAVEPCRLLDTRVASLRGGRLPAQGERDFLVFDADLALEQGGAEEGCGIPDTVRAVAINLTAVGAAGRGFVTAWDYGAPRPATATLNLIPGEDVNNQLSVAINTTSAAPELMVYSFASTHLVADIVGFYTQPVAQALECLNVISDDQPIVANGLQSVQTDACPTDYTLTSGSCVAGSFDLALVTTQSAVSGHFCAYRNNGPVASYFRAQATCCRNPGG